MSGFNGPPDAAGVYWQSDHWFCERISVCLWSLWRTGYELDRQRIGGWKVWVSAF